MSRDNLQNSPLSKREMLMSTTHEKLVDILISLYDNNYNLQTQLDIIFAGLDDNPKKIVILIKKEITYLKKSSRFVEYYQSDSLANDLNDLRLRIINDLQAKSPKIAFDMSPTRLDTLVLPPNLPNLVVRISSILFASSLSSGLCCPFSITIR